MSTAKPKDRYPTTKRPKASSLAARKRMLATKGRDTQCELAIRSLVHRKGLRFRVDWSIPGTRRRADLAFVSPRLLVFIDGCFWHACPKHGTWPKANAAWWRRKILDNARRDRDTDTRLKRDGWTVLRFWEHEASDRAADRIARRIKQERGLRGHRIVRKNARTSFTSRSGCSNAAK